MPKFTKEQDQAAEDSGTNIIVSAGAGSGKTTVLKERVLRKLKKGVKVNQLIILTFTKNAASEMKERIRKVIRENDDVKDQSELIDSAYITTFDSYANSLVKKYNYLLNIDKNFKIVDSAIIKIELKHILDDILEEYYASDNEVFKEMIKNYTIKNDNQIRKSILNIYSELTKLLDRTSFLDSYIDNFYSDDKIDKHLDEYEELVFKYHADVCDLLEKIDDLTDDNDTLEKNHEGTEAFRNASSLDDLLDIKIKLAPYSDKKYSDPKSSDIKNIITKKLKVINELVFEDRKMLKTHYLSTKKYVSILIDIIKELDKRILEYKRYHNVYEFNDIAALAIRLVCDFKEVRDEIKYSTHEIMIDEYQDTSDIQETFISYIANNNVYMVGDIKQSIYRFRNANPYIFKNKYDKYRDNDGGEKIDLKENFRSREEVVNNINLIFDSIMHDRVGGAKYKDEHQMVYGNKGYDKAKSNQNYDMEILSYKNEDNNYANKEVEAFIIADDILKRINDKEQVVYIDNGGMKLRDITFDDFAILVNKSTNFELLKKVLESKNIHCVIDKDIDIKEDDEIYILNNIVKLIICIHNNDLKDVFKHAYLSVGRSYVCNMSDDELFTIVNDYTYKDTKLYNRCKNIADDIEGLSNKDILTRIIKDFEMIDKLYTVGDVQNRIAKLENFLNDSISLNDLGMDIYDLNDYFTTLMNDDESIKMPSNANAVNTVKIMTIHNSKGLEYSYVYLPYLDTDFHKNANKDLFSFSSKYGFIVPFFDNGKGSTFIKQLNKNYNKVEEISERIRLFYVALTRAKEKVIMINQFNNNIESTRIDDNGKELESISSYRDILSLIKNDLIPYIKEVDLKSLDINDDYDKIRTYNYESFIDDTNDIIEVNEIAIDNHQQEDKHFSKSLTGIIDEELHEKLDFGTYMHYIFEVYDFKKDNIDELDPTDEEVMHLKSFLKHPEFSDIKNARIYKELEIKYEDEGNTYHGFIDLLLEYSDHFDIIDYKLSNIDSEEYKVQLNGYKRYIETRYNKKTNIYLYSIMQDILKKLD